MVTVLVYFIDGTSVEVGATGVSLITLSDVFNTLQMNGVSTKLAATLHLIDRRRNRSYTIADLTTPAPAIFTTDVRLYAYFRPHN